MQALMRATQAPDHTRPVDNCANVSTPRTKVTTPPNS